MPWEDLEYETMVLKQKFRQTSEIIKLFKTNKTSIKISLNNQDSKKKKKKKKRFSQSWKTWTYIFDPGPQNQS